MRRPVTEKYQLIISNAMQKEVMNLYVRELNNILYITGEAPTEDVKASLWELFNEIDPGYSSGDLVLNISLAATNVAA
jgi:hypothetical protein